VKILHTSDWHLGRSFHGAALLDEQAEALDRIASLVEREQVELVIVAGDLFDRAIPPAAAVELLGATLDRLAAAGAVVAAISGNHDSSVRVGGYDALLNRVGVALRGDHRRLDEPLVVESPRDGGPPVAVYLIPYLEPAAVAPDLLAGDGAADEGGEPLGSPPAGDHGGRSAADHEDALAASADAVDPDVVDAGAVRAAVDPAPEPEAEAAPAEPMVPVALSLFDLIEEPEVPVEATAPPVAPSALAAPAEPTAPRPTARGGRPTQDRVTRAAVDRIRAHAASLGEVRTVVVAHTFVAGGAVSDSERDLSVGNVERVSLATFDGFDLVALGHLHAPQELAGPRLAYAGSPLPYSFSEEGQTKSVRLVELAADGSVAASTVPLGVGRPVRTLRATLAELLEDARFADAEPAWVRALLTDPHLPDQAMARLRRRFPHALELRHEPAGGPRNRGGIVAAGELRRLDPLDLVLRFWEDQEGRPAAEPERDLLAAALAAVGEDGS